MRKELIDFSWKLCGYLVTALKNKFRFCESKFFVVLSFSIETEFLAISYLQSVHAFHA